MSLIPDHAGVRAELNRILTSPAFADAGRASAFLRFIVERSIEGRTQEIKESVIAVEVLGRSPGFDPKTDPIVRVEAGRLRGRLASWYETDGKDSDVTIALPKGGYAPVFSQRTIAAPSAEGKAEAVPAGFRWLTAITFGLAGLAIGILATFLFSRGVSNREILRLSVVPPPHVTLESAAISPDGRYLVFSGTPEGGHRQLWLRPLAEPEARPLPGTEAADLPFWSPDSRSVGFFVRNKLRRVEIAGGPPRDICPVRVGTGGASWGSRDVILFAPEPQGVIYQVSAGGGTPKPATHKDPAASETQHVFPSFLPDGRRFLYAELNPAQGKTGIRIASLDSSESTFVAPSDGKGVFAPPSNGQGGALIFAFQGALIAEAFDPDRAKLTGNRTVLARSLLDCSSRQPGGGEFSVSSQGTLAYRTGSIDTRQLGWFDRAGRLISNVGSPNNYYAWSLSPDEKRIAAMQPESASAVSSIWILEVARGVLSRLTEISGTPSFLPVWSPDGAAVFYSSGTVSRSRILRQTLDGGKPETVLDVPGPRFLSDLSRDGRFAAGFTPWPDFGRLNLFTIDLKSASPPLDKPFLPLRTASRSAAVFAPSGKTGTPRWVAYVSHDSGREEVFVASFPGGERKWQVSEAGGMECRWRADGRELYFRAPDGTLMAAAVKAGEDFHADPPRPLFRTATPGWRGSPDLPSPEYSPAADGTRFLVNRTIETEGNPPVTVLTPWR